MFKSFGEPHRREAAVVVAAQCDLTTIAGEFAEVHHVVDAVCDGGPAISGQEITEQVESDHPSALEDFTGMVISKMTLVFAAENGSAVGMGGDDPTGCTIKKIVERCIGEMRCVMHDAQFIKRRNQFPAFGGEPAVLSVAPCVPGASGPGQADQSQASLMPPSGVLGVSNGICAFHENAYAHWLIITRQFDRSVLNDGEAFGFQLLIDPKLFRTSGERLFRGVVFARILGVEAGRGGGEDRPEDQPNGAGDQIRQGNAAAGGIGAWLVNVPSFNRDAGKVKMSVDPWLAHRSSVPQRA